MQLLITGLASSGTTMLAALARKLGYDLGADADLYSRDAHRGLEWKPLLEVTQQIQQQMLDLGVNPTRPTVLVEIRAVTDRLIPLWKSHMLALNMPEVVKNPGMALPGWVVLQILRPQHTALMWRPLHQWAKARLNHKQGSTHLLLLGADRSREFAGMLQSGITAWALLTECLLEYRLPFTTVAFPLVVQDREYAASVLPSLFAEKSLADLMLAWEQVRDLEAVSQP